MRGRRDRFSKRLINERERDAAGELASVKERKRDGDFGGRRG